MVDPEALYCDQEEGWNAAHTALYVPDPASLWIWLELSDELLTPY